MLLQERLPAAQQMVASCAELPACLQRWHCMLHGGMHRLGLACAPHGRIRWQASLVSRILPGTQLHTLGVVTTHLRCAGLQGQACMWTCLGMPRQLRHIAGRPRG